MGTHAIYFLWVGVKKEDLEISGEELIEKVKSLNLNKGFELKIQPIHMHGEVIGYGEVICEMSWDTEPQLCEMFRPQNLRHLEFVSREITDAFQKLNISVIPKLYHHIDLGG